MKKRVKLRLGRIILCLLILVLIPITLVIIYNEKIFGTANNSSPKLNHTEPKEEIDKLSLVMVGDMLIHSSVYTDAYKNNTYDFKPMIEQIKPIVNQYDLAFYNQETILGGAELGVSTYPCFNSPYEVGDAMVDAGFNLVSLANNHTLDRGQKAIANSLNYWKDKEGIMTAGSYESFDQRDQVNIKTMNNISYSLLAYTYGTNGIPVPAGKEYLVNVYSNEQAKADIMKVRNQVDLLIVSMHWGTEYTHTPIKTQVEQAEYLASLGVDIIIGTHPHVIEPITKINNTLVIYSLGNFLSAQTGIEKLIGLMTSVNITKTVKDNVKTITIDNLSNELLYNSYTNWRNFKVIPFSNLTKAELANYQSLYNTYSAIVKKYDNTISVNTIH